MVERGTRHDEPMKRQVVAHELAGLLADDTIVSTGSGTVETWVAWHLLIVRDCMFSCRPR